MATKSKRKTTYPVVSEKSLPTPAAITAAETLASLTKLGSDSGTTLVRRFFKAGVGQYGSGDLFLGIKLPVLRAFVRDLKGAGIEVALALLKSGWHEARAVGLLLLIRVYQRGDEKTQKRIFALYLKSTKFTNNWDLVDMSVIYRAPPCVMR